MILKPDDKTGSSFFNTLSHCFENVLICVPHSESTEGTSYTLADRRIQDMLILVFKAVNNLLPTYLSDLFIIRENIKNLRGTNKLVIPNVNTTRYGTKSVAFTAPKAWNSLPDRLRSMKSLKDFKIAVRSM